MFDSVPERLICRSCGVQVERDDELELVEDSCYFARYECGECGAEGRIDHDPGANTTDCEGELFTRPERRADSGLALLRVLEDTPDPGGGSPTYFGRCRP